MHDEFWVDVEDLLPSSSAKVDVICDYCGKIVKKPYRDYLKQIKKHPKIACKACFKYKMKDVLSLKRSTYYEIFHDLCIKNGYKPISTLEDYVNATEYLEIECPKHGIQRTNYVRAKEGNFCPKCGYESSAKRCRLPTEKVIELVESKNNDKIINPEDYVNFGKCNLKIKCGNCGDIWTTSLASIAISDGLCPKCGAKKSNDQLRLTPDEVQRRIESVNGNILLNPQDYIKNNVKNLKVKCGNCGRVFVVSLSNYEYNDVTRCPVCTQSESKAEKDIREFLEDNHINYESEKRFDDCRDKMPLPFDFYLPNYNLCIEFDGPHHYRPIYNNIKHFKSTQKHDKMKNDYCKINNINLIRIPYWDGHNIEQILTQKLSI